MSLKNLIEPISRRGAETQREANPDNCLQYTRNVFSAKLVAMRIGMLAVAVLRVQATRRVARLMRENGLWVECSEIALQLLLIIRLTFITN